MLTTRPSPSRRPGRLPACRRVVTAPPFWLFAIPPYSARRSPSQATSRRALPGSTRRQSSEATRDCWRLIRLRSSPDVWTPRPGPGSTSSSSPNRTSLSTAYRPLHSKGFWPAPAIAMTRSQPPSHTAGPRSGTTSRLRLRHGRLEWSRQASSDGPESGPNRRLTQVLPGAASAAEGEGVGAGAWRVERDRHRPACRGRQVDEVVEPGRANGQRAVGGHVFGPLGAVSAGDLDRDRHR